MVGEFRLDPKKDPSSKGEFENVKTIYNANIFQLVVVTKACYGVSICRNSYDTSCVKDFSFFFLVNFHEMSGTLPENVERNLN